jgi:biotin synthase
MSRIKKELSLAITLSAGELSYEDYKRLREAGVDRYLIRFETSDPRLFKELKPDSDHKKRIEILHWLAEIGFQVGSGIMVGLPGQTPETLADDILLFRELGLDMVGNGPFIPNPETPLSGSKGGDLTSSLKLIALTRLVVPDAHIPATTALGTIDPEGRRKGLACGANVIMPNVTPRKYGKDYLLYPGKICVDERPEDCRACIENALSSMGRKVSAGYGHSLRYKS